MQQKCAPRRLNQSAVQLFGYEASRNLYCAAYSCSLSTRTDGEAVRNADSMAALASYQTSRSSGERGKTMTINQILQAAVQSSAIRRLPSRSRPTQAPEVSLRQAVIGVSVVGIAAVAAASLYRRGATSGRSRSRQRSFDFGHSDLSLRALKQTGPQSPLSLLSHAVNIALAAAGSKRRARKSPWIAISASLAAVPAALTALQYLLDRRPIGGRRSSTTATVDAVSHIAALGFTLYEALKAFRHVKQSTHAATPASRLLH